MDVQYLAVTITLSKEGQQRQQRTKDRQECDEGQL
jgi:hypothetical protein